MTGGALLVLPAAGLLVVATVRPADACQCMPTPPPCEAAWQNDVVFLGTVTRDAPGPPGPSIATFSVEKTFRGALASTVTVSSYGECTPRGFRVGGTFVVYARVVDGQLWIPMCSRTRAVADAAEDLAYLRAIPTRTEGVVDGTVTFDPHDAKGSHARVAGAGLDVRARGTTRSTRTDRLGRYRLSLPAGTHTIDVSGRGVRIPGGRGISVVLPDAAACARRDVDVAPDGRIQGRVRDRAGRPVAHVVVEARRVAPAGAYLPWTLEARTDARGRFEIRDVPAGELVVGVSLDGPTAAQPIPTTYYPGASAAAGATAIRMTSSGRVSNIDLSIPAPLAVYTVSGTVRRAGKAVAHPGVTISAAPWGRSVGMATDAAGRFSHREVAGTQLTVQACRYDQTPNCTNVVQVQLDRSLEVDLHIPP